MQAGVIVITGRSEGHLERRALDAGAICFLRKPLRADALARAITLSQKSISPFGRYRFARTAIIPGRRGERAKICRVRSFSGKEFATSGLRDSESGQFHSKRTALQGRDR
jgi:DNA-binding response OmpR family regulator